MYRILLFAVLKDAAQREALEIDDPRSSLSVPELLEACAAACPALGKYLSHVRLAVDCEYVAGDDPDVRVRPTQEIALIPPVSGGAGGRR
jgi:molybdopterin converting factor small subunit